MSERYEHMLSVIEQQICAEAFKAAQHEGQGWADIVAEDNARCDDWKVLYDAIGEGLLDRLKAEYADRRALIGGVL